jgi:hypothetical protein
MQFSGLPHKVTCGRSWLGKAGGQVAMDCFQIHDAEEPFEFAANSLTHITCT